VEAVALAQLAGFDPALAEDPEGVLGCDAEGLRGSVGGEQVELEGLLVGGDEDLDDRLEADFSGGLASGPDEVSGLDLFNGPEALFGGDEGAGDETDGGR
jgi:hypothetical protein